MNSSESLMIESKKKYLKRYKRTKECIDRLKDKLQLLDDKLTKVKSPNYSGMPRGGLHITVADLIGDKEEVEERIKRMEVKAHELKVSILSEIDNLEDVRFAGILEAFFIDCKSFEEISKDKGYNVKSVIRLYSQGIKELVYLDTLNK